MTVKKHKCDEIKPERRSWSRMETERDEARREMELKVTSKETEGGGTAGKRQRARQTDGWRT